MRCKNCKTSFGLDLDLGFENENIGSCMICTEDTCGSCGSSLRIGTLADCDPVVICFSCIGMLAPREAVA